ncbi:MAG: substrate-binding domain-containing protein [Acidimicrobiales bacterium]|jgi:ribose transport system substrate-binding protein
MNTRAGLRKLGSKSVIGLLATASVAIGGQVPATAQAATLRPMVTESHALVTSSSAADLLTTFTKPAKPFTIDLSNNYIGNTFRLQMQAEAKVASNMAPFKGVVSVHVVTSQNTVQAQLQDLENMVGQHPDAIIIDAGSATGLNGVIAKACAAKIVVVSFDQQVTAPCAWKIGTDFGSIEAELATWLVTVMHDKGQIAVDRGLPGTPIADQMLSTELSVYKKFPGIKIVGEFNGNYAAGPEQEGVAAILASHPDLTGATGDGWGALPAFLAAGKTDANVISWGPAEALTTCAQQHAKHPLINCVIGTNGPDLSVLAMQVAVNVLEHDVAGSARFFATNETIFTTADIPLPGYPKVVLSPIVLGKSLPSNLPPSLNIPWTPSFMNIPWQSVYQPG